MKDFKMFTTRKDFIKTLNLRTRFYLKRNLKYFFLKYNHYFKKLKALIIK